MKALMPMLKTDPLMLVTDEAKWEWDEEWKRWKRNDVPDEIWTEMVTIEGSEENVKIILEKLERDA